MYRCNNCRRDFEQYDTIKEASGERWYVCPYCRGTDFDEIQQREPEDKFKLIKKEAVIDYVVTAVAYLNKGEIDTAKEVLTELIEETVGDSPFEYQLGFDTVSDEETADKLIAQLQAMLEVVRV